MAAQNQSSINARRHQWFAACSSGNCVEVTLTDLMAYIRDSKQNELGIQQPIIALNLKDWVEFLDQVAADEIAEADGVLVVEEASNGWVELLDTAKDITLSFDAQEWGAFTTGVKAGRFTPADRSLAATR